jgi:hypothetical protein
MFRGDVSSSIKISLEQVSQFFFQNIFVNLSRYGTCRREPIFKVLKIVYSLNRRNINLAAVFFNFFYSYLLVPGYHTLFLSKVPHHRHYNKLRVLVVETVAQHQRFAQYLNF